MRTPHHHDGHIVILVRDVMTPAPLVMATPGTTCAEARDLLDRHRIRHLPVVENGHLIGLVTDRDLRPVTAEASTVVVERIMARHPVNVPPHVRLEQAARRMIEGRIGALLVVERGTIVGIVSYVDVLRAFVRVLETATEERIAVDVRDAA
jgi:acetoin utilization protein AcuB